MGGKNCLLDFSTWLKYKWVNLWSSPCAINCGLMPILISPSKERKKRQDFSEQCSTQLSILADSAVCMRNLKWLSLPFVMTWSVSTSCRIAGWVRSSRMKGAVLLENSACQRCLSVGSTYSIWTLQWMISCWRKKSTVAKSSCNSGEQKWQPQMLLVPFPPCIYK